MIEPQYLENFPIENSYTIPSKWYYEDEIFELEKKTIFNKSWHLIGSKSKIPNPGDTIIYEVLDNPIIIVRQEDSSIKAFYNVCQHRGGPIIRENCSVKFLQCKYHGWIYEIDGSLKKVRDFSEVKNFQREYYGLKSINLKIWMDMIFINFSKNNLFDMPIDNIKGHIYPLNISSYKYHSRVSYNIKSNWKIYIDNYLEGYHIPFVHPRLNKLIDYKSYQTELFDNYSLQWSPIKPELSPYKKIKTSLNKAFYFTIFPNLLLNIAPGRLQTNIVEPRSSNSCRVHFDYYFEDLNDKSIITDFKFSEEVQQEDIQICQEVQKGLESNGFDRGRISKKSEKGLHHFQSILKKCFSDG